MSTKSFIISLPIITGDQDRRRLRKSFSFGCNLQNAVMGGGWDRVLRMRATPEWQATRAMPKGRERTKAFRDLRVRFRLSEYDFLSGPIERTQVKPQRLLVSIASIASITAERKPFLSSAATPMIVVPPGEQTASFIAPGCAPVSSWSFAVPASIWEASE